MHGLHVIAGHVDPATNDSPRGNFALPAGTRDVANHLSLLTASVGVAQGAKQKRIQEHL